MRNLIYIVLALTLGALTSFGQGMITGRVVDETDKAGIEFSTVTLFNAADSSLVSGTVTDSTGMFALENVASGIYYVKFSFIGYKANYISSLTIDPQNPVADLGEVALNSSSELGTVDITVNQNVFETKIDKKVFNADQNLTSKGGNGLDLLRQIPTITVDENDNILLRGDANVTILIDGRPSSMPANQLLRQIPASAIEKVEIITNPSAKYDPEGVSGIINIVMKKSKLNGFNGTIDTSIGYGIFPKSNSTIGLNYRNNKINLFTNYSFYYGQTWFGGEMDRDVMLADSSWDRLRSDDYGERKNTYHSGRVGFDYFANEKNTIYFTANMDYGTNFGNRLMNYNNVGAGEELLYRSQRNGEINAPSYNYVFTGGWQKTFNKPDHTLFLDLNFSNLQFNGDEWLWHKYFDATDVNYTTNYQHTLDKTYNQTLLAKLDYVLPINDSTIFEAGFHFTQRIADNDFFSESAGNNQQYTTDTLISNHFKYLQNTFAPYVTFSKQFKKLGVKLGVRAEPTQTLAEMITTNESYKQDYFQLFPSAHFSYNFNEYTVMQLSYSRRINRPELEQLNPFTNYSDNLTLETGNPFLKPEIIHVNELSFMRFWQKFNINVTGYYRLINDLIRRELFYDGVYTHITNTNLGTSSLSGGDLILTYSPIKGMRITSSTSVWNTSTRDQDITGGNVQNYTGMYSSLMASYRIKGGWSFQLWGSYSPQAKVIQGYIRENYGGGFAINKRLFHDKASINLSVYDVLKSRWFGFESYNLGNYNMNSYRYWESRSAYLSFTYNFGKLTEGKERRQNNSGGIGDDLDVPISN
ncbi:MAG: TonB-dependent receptor [Crocinitomicaceae bacterium]|nr:TonB-dependent receptor [Crocinitomicaceae bacterium]